MGSVVNLGSVILQYGINGLGATVIAGHTTARKLFMLCALPNISMGMAISTFVSQNKGAGQRERIIRGVKESYVYDLVCGLFTIVILFLFADELAVLISGSRNPELIGNVVAYVRFAAVFSGILGVLHQRKMPLCLDLCAENGIQGCHYVRAADLVCDGAASCDRILYESVHTGE